MRPGGLLGRAGRGVLAWRLPWHMQVRWNVRAISVAEGMRAALSTATILALNDYLQWPALTEAALAALFTCLCDAGGPIHRRLPALIAFGTIGSLITGGIGLAHAGGPAMVLTLAGLSVFLTSFVRVYGASPQQVGNLLSVILVLAADRAVPDLNAAARLAGSFAFGSLWAIVLTMLIWRIRPYLPARRAVAEAFRELAELAYDLRGLLVAEERVDDVWERHARLRRRPVREAIEQARSVVVATVSARGTASERGGQSLLRLETADQIFSALIALSDLLEHERDAEVCAHAARILRLLVPLLLKLARLTVSDAVDADGRLDKIIGAMAAETAALPPESALAHTLDALMERLRIAATLSTPRGYRPEAPLESEAPRHWIERLIGPPRANLTPKSAALRHALRVAVTAVPALAITMYAHSAYGHWLTITMIVTMQPYFAPTVMRAIERIGGTIAGGLLAAGIAVFCTTPLTVSVALFPLAVAALSLRAVNFALFMTFLTPLVVLLSELGQPGASEWMIAGMRALYTFFGGMMALVGSMLLWPSWEPSRLGGEVRTALRTHGDYAAAVLSCALGEIDESRVEVARRAAGVATNNVEASVQRALLEPGTTPRARLEAAMLIDAALRRMAGRLSAMQMDGALAAELGRERCRGWRAWISLSLAAIASGKSDIAPRPPLGVENRHAEALGRIARQIELMAGAIGRAMA